MMANRIYNKRFTTTRLVAVAVVAMATPTFASTVFFDGFGDGNYDQGSLSDVENIGGVDVGPVLDGPVEDAGDVGATWLTLTGSNSLTVAIADDSAGIGSGNALTVDVGNKDTRSIGTQFSSRSMDAVGNYVRLSFDVRLDSLAPLETGFRFGFYNSNGTFPLENSGTGADSNDDLGYNAALTLGPPAVGATTALIVGDDGAVVDISGKSKDGLFRDENGTDLGSSTTDAAGALNDLLSHHVVFEISRVADDVLTGDPMDLLLTLIVDGNPLLSNTLSGAGLDPSVSAFDVVYFGTVGADKNDHSLFLLDNVHVVAVPEPAALALMGLGGLALIGRKC